MSKKTTTPTFSAAHPTLAQPTLARVTKYFKLLSDLGFDELMDQAADAARAKLMASKGIAERAKAAEAGLAKVEVTISVADVMKRAVERNVLVRLGEILFEVERGQADEIPVGAMAEALGPFAEASMQAFAALMRLGGGSASKAASA